ncbi:glutamyl-tRNA(Gln) amidotransferase subunit C, mitochondrial [Culicoides brevitarsis]|uniref:glutamyl-tRNA(Gln) amidotransferase subunit C, mitochondrial n=1 Tax=Culicoides brevitarsis TaxID=469753 RepID=UPI00307BAA0B
MFRQLFPLARAINRQFSGKNYVKISILNARNCSTEHKTSSPTNGSHDVFDDIKDHKMKGKAVEKIDKETLELLERLSLVNIEDEEAIQTLEEAVAFASQILDIDTEGVEPMYTVAEDFKQKLREDIPFTHNTQERILSNAAVTEEGYFVAPPGNIPLETEDFDKDAKEIKKKSKK